MLRLSERINLLEARSDCANGPQHLSASIGGVYGAHDSLSSRRVSSPQLLESAHSAEQQLEL